MNIIAEPVKEEEILAVVEKEAKAEDIYLSMVAKAECCVDHLCGCGGTGGCCGT